MSEIEQSIETRINALNQMLENTKLEYEKYSAGLCTEEEYSCIESQRKEWLEELESLTKGVV